MYVYHHLKTFPLSQPMLVKRLVNTNVPPQEHFVEQRYFSFFGQVKVRRKLKSTDKDNGPTSPTVPSITYDSVFDSGRELSSDVYSTVGTGTVCYANL